MILAMLCLWIVVFLLPVENCLFKNPINFSFVASRPNASIQFSSWSGAEFAISCATKLHWSSLNGLSSPFEYWVIAAAAYSRSLLDLDGSSRIPFSVAMLTESAMETSFIKDENSASGRSIIDLRTKSLSWLLIVLFNIFKPIRALNLLSGLVAIGASMGSPSDRSIATD